ncbi:hypothetical protein AAG612_03275 [Citromicrobium bathyomarinum]|uniref:hypothetical protein n=1 Tax=Citromicrobium bathyomarinum TaxID=72174 RepID=UPI00315AC24B
MHWGKLLPAIAGIAALPGCIAFPDVSAFPEWAMIQEQMAAEAKPIQLDPLILDQTDDFVIDASIAGQPVRLLVDLSHSGIALNPDAAERLGLAPLTSLTSTRIGPVTVRRWIADAQVASGPVSSQQRLSWTERPITDEADGIVNIANLPNPSVTLNLRPRRSEDRAITLPTRPRGGFALAYVHDDAGQNIDVRFLLSGPRSMATTATGAYLAETYGGSWDGPRRAHPILYGVERPVRPMRFARPVSFGGILFQNPLVRMRDYQGEDLLPQDAPSEETTITVQGVGERTSAEHFVYVAYDILGQCSSITYVRATRNLTLVCPPAVLAPPA